MVQRERDNVAQHYREMHEMEVPDVVSMDPFKIFGYYTAHISEKNHDELAEYKDQLRELSFRCQ